MACRWTYKKNGDINGAKTQNGAPSVLFQELQNKFGLEKAIEMYEVSQSDEFQEVIQQEEPEVELVVNYITEQNKSNKPLSKKQKVDLNNVMQATGIYSMNELEKTLVDVFYDENNIFVINPQKIRNSGLYSEYELRNLSDNQEMVKQAVEALQSTPREEEGFVETSEKELFDKTSEFNSFGKLNVISPQKIKEEIFEKTVGLDREQFDTVLNNLEYPNYLKTVDKDALFAEVSQYYKAEAFQEVNGQIVPTTVDNTDVELSLVNREYSDDLVNVVSHISKILDQGSFNIYEDLKTLETLSSKVGLDLVGITDKFITQEFLDEIALFLTEQPNNFSQLYKDIFVKNENQKFDFVKKVAGKDLDLVTLNTTLSEEQLYNDYGLIKVSEGVYTRMNKIPLEELYERVGLALDRDDLQQYVRENVTNLENFKNSDNAEAVVLYKLYLNENEQLSQTKSNQIERGGEIATRVSNFLRRQGGTNEKNSAIRQKSELENFAKKEGYWIANYRKLGEYIGKGMESQVFLSKDGTKVYKVNDLEFYDTPITYLNTIKEHNRLFPESSYRVIGFTERTDTENFSFIVEQPFIEAIRGASQEEVNKELERLGFSAVGQAESYIKDNIEILDLHEGNVIVDKKGNIFFIDPVIFVEEIIVSKPQKNTSKFTGDYKYLTEKYPTDFHTKIIEEKVKDSIAYKEFYSNFGVNNQGIYLKIDNIKNADIYADENLKQYSLLSKQLPDLTMEDINIEQSKRDALYNNPESISPFKGQYSKLSDNEIIIKNTSEEFLKVDGEIYEFLEKNGNLSLFAKVGRNTSNYNVVNLEKPSSNVNLEAFAYLETKPETFIKTKNLLSKEERQNVEENFEC